jgi:hypothetical protein
MLEIERETFLRVVVLKVISAARALAEFGRARPEALPARTVAVGRELDLDHLRTQLCQDPGADWPGDELGYIEYPVSGEHS